MLRARRGGSNGVRRPGRGDGAGPARPRGRARRRRAESSPPARHSLQPPPSRRRGCSPARPARWSCWSSFHAADALCLWPKGEPLKIVAHAGTSKLNLTIKSAAQWFSATGTLEVDEGRTLDLKQLFALLDASPGSRFLELGAGEFIALTASFRRHLDDLRGISSPGARGSVRMHGTAALALRDFAARATLDADAGWRAQQERLNDADAFEPELPSTLQAELRPYQHDGFRWLARLARWGAGACLADDMGLGKTVQTLALLLDRAPDGPALVVAPTSVVANWFDGGAPLHPHSQRHRLHRGRVLAHAAAREPRTFRRGRHHLRIASERCRHARRCRLAQRRA